MNSVIQSLFTFERFNNYFLSEAFHDIEYETIKKINISKSYSKLLHSMIDASGENLNVINPSFFHQRFKNLFNLKEQQDAHEFMRIFLSDLQDELNPKKFNKLYSEKNKKNFDFMKFYQENHPSIVDKLFAGMIENHVQCQVTFIYIFYQEKYIIFFIL